MKIKDKQKPKNVDYFRVLRPLWHLIKKHLPKPPKKRGPGRPRVDNRAVVNGLWYILWTGCQWKAVHKAWFGISSSVLHERFQTWQQQGIWDKVLRALARFYHRQQRISWKWLAIDSKSVPAPLGGSDTGGNPTDRGKRGAKIHLLVDQRGAPLAIYITGANRHDKWSVAKLVVSIVVAPTNQEKHLGLDKAYDSANIHQLVSQAGYQGHIAHRRRRGESPPNPVAGEHKYPASLGR